MAIRSSTAHILAMFTLSVLGFGCSGQFARDTSSRTLRSCGLEGSKLSNNVISTHALESKLQCSRLCLEDASCASLNWKTGGGLCELNSSDKTTDAANLVPDNDFFYWAPDNCPGYTVPTTPAYQCLPPDKIISDRCVSVITTSSQSWDNADAFCKAKAPVGSWTLLTFEQGRSFYNQVEAHLFTTAHEQTAFWIGLHDDGGTWKWIDPASTPFGTPEKSMFYLLQDQPSVGIPCAALAYKYGTYELTGYKRDDYCNMARKFICQKYT